VYLNYRAIDGLIINLDSVLVTPDSKPDSDGALMGRKFDCDIKRTWYAHIAKIQENLIAKWL